MQSVPITTQVVSLNPVHSKVYSIQYYVIKFVCGFLRVLRFPPPIKLTITTIDLAMNGWLKVTEKLSDLTPHRMLLEVNVFYKINNKQGQRKAWHIPSLKNLTWWPWKSIGFQILLKTKYVPSLVKIHWRMLILECSQGCYGRMVAHYLFCKIH
jgi:hypothetical protein